MLLDLTRTAHLATLMLYAGALVLSAWGLLQGRPRLERAGWGTAAAGLAAQTALLAVRWAAAGYLPVTGLFSTLHFLAMWVAAVGLYFGARYRAGPFLPAALVLVLAALAGASQGTMELFPLTPALDTPLFLIHVATSFAAYGLFGVAALVAAYRTAGMPASRAGWDRRMLDECLYIGYVLFTWCMIAGSLWAFLAWGSYWTWRIKGLWSTILWFYYSAVIHVRHRPGWQGWPVNLLAMVGFGLVLFTYLGLGLLFETSHPLS